MLSPTIGALVLASVTAHASQPALAADVGWMAGCWELNRGSRHVVEHWLPPEGGTLLGVSRTVADGKTVEYEFLVIRERSGGLEYVAKPSGQAEAVFTLTRLAEQEVVFENPTHDFPERIIYRKQADGGLAARIEGTIKDAPRAVDFVYRPATCAP